MNTKTKAEAAKSGKAQRELFDIMASSNKIDKILTLLTTQKGIPIDKVFKVEHSDECKLEKELGENYIGSYIWIGLTYGLKSIFETDFKRHSEPRLPSTAQINH